MDSKIIVRLPGFEIDSFEISKERFLDIQNSRNVLFEALSFEEKFDLILSNYLEFEKTLMDHTIEFMVKSNHDYLSSYQVRLSFNLRISNLLGSIRQYRDHLTKHLKVCLPRNEESTELIKQKFSKEYDQFFEFRFIEALRNYVQHYGLPVHSVVHKSKWIPNPIEGDMLFSIDLFVFKKDLLMDSTFKKSVLNEMPEKVELSNTLRRYVESLNKIHLVLRNAISDSVKKSRANIEKLFSESEDEFGSKKDLLYIDEIFPSIQESNRLCSVFLHWDDVRLKILETNRSLVNLTKRKPSF
ncbi:MAG: hypothetical protein ACJLTB_20250 [Algoriphagus aquaeductus]|uniref:hypothetical protein n=1 Tax=Algoriphagus aquaeductus TaxID=475299 RepID=UPI00387A14D2